MLAKQNKEFIHYCHQQAGFSHFQESRAPSHIVVTWEDKCHHSKCVPLFFCSQILLLSMMSYGMGYPFAGMYGTGYPFGQLGPAVSLPSPLCTPSLLTGGAA